MKQLVSILITVLIAMGQTELQQGTSGTGTGIWFNTGNVGIGTTSPSEKLNVESNAAGYTAHFKNKSGNGTAGGLLIETTEGNSPGANALFVRTRITNGGIDAFTVKNNGNVGIGTTSPRSTLQLKKNTNTNSETILSISSNWENAVANKGIGSIQFTGHDQDYLSGAEQVASEILVQSEEIWASASSANAYMSFKVLGDGVTSERLRINSDGNVGIGTTNPNSELHIKASSNDDATITLSPKATGVGGYIGRFQKNNDLVSGSSYETYISNGGKHVNAGGENDYGMDNGAVGTQVISLSSNGFRFLQKNSTAIASELMRIKTNGKIGIGTETPLAKLQVEESNTHTLGMYNGYGNLLLYNNHDGAENYGAFLTFGSQYSGNGGVPGFTTRAAIKGGTSTYGNTANGFLSFYTASGGANNNFERMRIDHAGNVGIGTTTPQSKLAVNGTVTASKVVVTTTGWPDYVFTDDYDLKSLEETEVFIKKNKHLPNMPSEKEVLKNGQDLGAMQQRLLEKIEELTLHMIEMKKTHKAEINKLKSEIQKLQ